MTDEAEPVSYTHLDVYKRQPMNRIYKRAWGEKQKDGRFEFHI